MPTPRLRGCTIGRASCCLRTFAPHGACGPERKPQGSDEEQGDSLPPPSTRGSVPLRTPSVRCEYFLDGREAAAPSVGSALKSALAGCALGAAGAREQAPI